MRQRHHGDGGSDDQRENHQTKLDSHAQTVIPVARRRACLPLAEPGSIPQICLSSRPALAGMAALPPLLPLSHQCWQNALATTLM